MYKYWNNLIDKGVYRLNKLAKKGKRQLLAANVLAIISIIAFALLALLIFWALWLIASYVVDSLHYFAYPYDLVVKGFLFILFWAIMKKLDGWK